MADVERRGPAVRSKIVAVLQSRALACGAEKGGSVVNRFADGVGTLEIETVTPLVSDDGNGAVVVGVADVHAGSNGAEQWIREMLDVGRLIAAHGGIVDHNGWLVLINEQAELAGGGTLIVD